MALQFACIIHKPTQRKKKNIGHTVVLEAVTRREQSLALFHLLGKVLYNKRSFCPLFIFPTNCGLVLQAKTILQILLHQRKIYERNEILMPCSRIHSSFLHNFNIMKEGLAGSMSTYAKTFLYLFLCTTKFVLDPVRRFADRFFSVRSLHSPKLYPVL